MNLEELRDIGGITYVSVPYTAHLYGLAAAAYDADRHAAHLIKMGFVTFSPISHSHPIARVGGLDPRSHELWMAQNDAFMEACSAMVAVHIPGWEDSIGMKMEREAFARMGKPVVEMEMLP